MRSSAPTSTSADIIIKLNEHVNGALADPNIKARLADLGATPIGGSSISISLLIAEEIEKWAKVINAVGLKAD
jgi:tripartite-type tricarboxylate transporter receptor subunit TctC